MQRLLRIVIIPTIFFLLSICANAYDRISKPILRFDAYNTAVEKLALSPDGLILYSSGGAVKAWDVSTGDLIQNIHDGELLDISPDGERILIKIPGEILLYDLNDFTLITSIVHGSFTHEAVFSADGSKILTAGADWTEDSYLATIKIWNTNSEELISTHIRPSTQIQLSTGTIIPVTPVECSKISRSINGDYLFLSNIYWGEIAPGALVPFGYGELVRISDWSTLHAYSESYLAAFSPVADIAAVITGNIYIHDLHENVDLGHFGRAVNICDFSPDGKYILTDIGLDNTEIATRGVVWDAVSREIVCYISSPNVASTAGLWTEHGNRIIIATEDGEITVWDMSDLAQSSIGQEAEAYGEQ